MVQCPSSCQSAVLVLFSLLISASLLTAQEQLGMRLERHAGIYSTTLNPANVSFNPRRWDLSLGEADVYASNNFAFFRDASLPKILRAPDAVFSIADTSAERPIPTDAILLDFYDRNRRLNGVVQARVAGPSFSFKVGDYHTFGLETALRMHASAYRVPEVFEYGALDQLPRYIPTQIDPVAATAMAWGEIGLVYNYHSADGPLVFSAGIVPKLLIGLEGAYANASGAFDYTPETGDTVAFGAAHWNYGVALGNLSSTNADSMRIRRQGLGGSVSLGASWAMPAADGDTNEDYQWRFGISLLDLGVFASTGMRKNTRLCWIPPLSSVNRILIRLRMPQRCFPISAMLFWATPVNRCNRIILAWPCLQRFRHSLITCWPKTCMQVVYGCSASLWDGSR
ncbi:MAG: hypothetical protein IPL65_16760 [Lewinellaceae bacterium]|nr:hypothetical protein [Lewinellaceae bacterium]